MYIPTFSRPIFYNGYKIICFSDCRFGIAVLTTTFVKPLGFVETFSHVLFLTGGFDCLTERREIYCILNTFLNFLSRLRIRKFSFTLGQLYLLRIEMLLLIQIESYLRNNGELFENYGNNQLNKFGFGLLRGIFLGPYFSNSTLPGTKYLEFRLNLMYIPISNIFELNYTI